MGGDVRLPTINCGGGSHTIIDLVKACVPEDLNELDEYYTPYEKVFVFITGKQLGKLDPETRENGWYSNKGKHYVFISFEAMIAEVDDSTSEVAFKNLQNVIEEPVKEVLTVNEKSESKISDRPRELTHVFEHEKWSKLMLEDWIKQSTVPVVDWNGTVTLKGQLNTALATVQKQPTKYIVTFLQRDMKNLILSKTAVENFISQSNTVCKDLDLVCFTGDNDENYVVNKKLVLSIVPENNNSKVINTLA